MATYSQAGRFGPAAIPGAPVGVPLRVVDAAGSDAVLYADASKNKTVGPIVQANESGLVSFYADPGTYTVRWTGGSTTVTVSGGVAESEGTAVDALTASQIAVGEETIPRLLLTSAAVSTATTGTMRLAYFSARKTETSTQVRMYSGSTAAAATPTLVRVGIYSIDGAGDGTLVAATANDTSLFASTNTSYTRSWEAPFTKAAGQRYALAVLVVSATTVPSFLGSIISNVTEAATAPRVGAALGSQTDLPASFTAGSLGNSGQLFYAAVLP